MPPSMGCMTAATATPPLLTKSKFKLGLQCPRKLYYASRPALYADASQGDEFLQQLAEGGHQVGELAKLMFAGGVDLSDLDVSQQLARTNELLQLKDVTIFEAAVQAGPLFARIDILRKSGPRVEVIEVKAKAFDPQQDAVFKGLRGGFKAGYLPYLQDVAFQSHVLAQAHPHLTQSCSLMFANTAAQASVQRLNQMFRLESTNGHSRVKIRPGVDARSVGEPLLVQVPLGALVDEVLDAPVDLGPSGCQKLRAAIGVLADAHTAGTALPARIRSACKSCQFKVEGNAGPLRSGFHECWRADTGLKDEDLERPLVTDLWNSRRIDPLLRERRFLLSQLTDEDIGHDGSAPGAEGLSLSHIHAFQRSGSWPGGGAFYVHPGLAATMQQWRFPLHFVDFETASAALPFHMGGRPYETVAFQFSHHVLEADGSARHASQFLHAVPGEDPRVPFLRALKASLSGDAGTVFRWHNHENTVLNQLIDLVEIWRKDIPDAEELIDFAMSLVRRGDHAGAREMVDLCHVSQRHFFHPSTKGSPSLKKVLPALMQCSAALRQTYSQPVYGKGAQIDSLNFDEPVVWWQEQDGVVLDPYELLPPVGSGAAAMSALRNGGAAMAAYGLLQLEGIDDKERSAIQLALLRYCELDTLAMLMAVQAWRAWAARCSPM